MKKFFVPILALIVLGAGCVAEPVSQPVRETSATEQTESQPETKSPAASQPESELGLPLDRASERVTKKPFGLRVTQKDSPVQPERFSGYHVGVDFETFAEEQDIDVPVLAVCDGTLLLKRTATGYGGVAVQSCALDGQDVTIVYGHLKLSSIAMKAGDAVKRGERLGILGKGYSAETDGERKHLHLGIHIGKETNIRGYEQRETDLAEWLDAKLFLPL